MKIDIQKNGHEWEGGVFSSSHVVLIDILRATSSIVTAFHYGCRAVIPVSGLFDAFRKRRHDHRVLLCGERFGVRVPGFDFGNSPTDLATPEVRGKELIFTSSNGTKIFCKVPYESRGFILSFLNMDTVARALLKEGKDVLIVCAGRRGGDAEEDWLAAGMLASLLSEKASLSFMATSARDHFQKQQKNLCQLLRESEHGERLSRRGNEKDVFLCASRNIMPVVPVLYQRRITLWT